MAHAHKAPDGAFINFGEGGWKRFGFYIEEEVPDEGPIQEQLCALVERHIEAGDQALEYVPDSVVLHYNAFGPQIHFTARLT